MTWKDIVRKISSRKFIATATAVVIAVSKSVDINTGFWEGIIATVGAFAALIVYVFIEGKIDEAAVSHEDSEEA